MGWYGFAPYVSVAKRRKNAQKIVTAMKKKGQTLRPVIVEGRTIAKTFWGKAWCQHLESYSDYENRLPRGRTYVRNGSVIDLQMTGGEINALVSGSSVYKVSISIMAVAKNRWNNIIDACSGKIDSLIELLQGKLSNGIMTLVTHRELGLFPNPKEIKMSCSCPDWADMCKHIAAVLYGVGARLDEKPEELFVLRQADHTQLIAGAPIGAAIAGKDNQPTPVLAGEDLGALFGIELAGNVKKNAARSKIIRTQPKPKKPLLLLPEKTKKAAPKKKTKPIKGIKKPKSKTVNSKLKTKANKKT